MQHGLREQLLEIQPRLRERGIVHLAVFGSRARSDFRDDSDLDLLLDVSPHYPFSLLDLVEVERVVAGKTGLPANAFMKRSLDSGFRASIAKDVVEVF